MDDDRLNSLLFAAITWINNENPISPDLYRKDI